MTEAMPVVTVVIPCYNMGAFVEASVQSVRAQSYRGHEIVIVDDGSDDPETVSVLDRLRDGGVTLIRTSNGGVAAARNRAIGAAGGKYILPLDADDLIDPRYLEQAVRFLEEDPALAVVSCDAEYFQGASGVRRLPVFSRERLLSENLLFAASLFRKSDWERAGGYCSAFRYGWEDWDFWIALTKEGGRVLHIPEPLLKYRIRSDSRDRSMALWQKMGMLLLILARHFDCYLRSPMSLFRLIGNARPMMKA